MGVAQKGLWKFSLTWKLCCCIHVFSKIQNIQTKMSWLSQVPQLMLDVCTKDKLIVCRVALQHTLYKVFGSYLAGYNLLQGVLTLDVGVVSHDDHDDRHEFVHQSQWAVFQLSSQDALWMHVRDFLDFLRGMKVQTGSEPRGFSCSPHGFHLRAKLLCLVSHYSKGTVISNLAHCTKQLWFCRFITRVYVGSTDARIRD